MLFLSSFLCQDLIFAAVLLGASIVLYSFFLVGFGAAILMFLWFVFRL